MTQQATDQYIKVCMKTWLLCEASVHAESEKPFPRTRLVKECADCAKACFALVSGLVSDSGYTEDLVLRCFLQCRQCTIECGNYPNEEDIQYCGLVSALCAETMHEMISARQLN